jgi:hypothetical protein
LANEVVLVDDAAQRALVLAPLADQTLERTSVPIGKGVLRTDVSPDKRRLFVLSAGDTTPNKATREGPSLTVIEGTSVRQFPLSSTHSGLAIDPEGRWVALFSAPPTADFVRMSAFVENPNEIVLVDLKDNTVTARTLRSFGGVPQRVSFTPALHLPAGPRHLLVIETEQDVALLDLENAAATPARPEITVRLSTGSSALPNRPGGIRVDDGDPARADDARIGVRLENSSNVVSLTLVESTKGAKAEDPTQTPNDFRAEVNLADVGGIPSDIAFVRTDLGVRLAALVPSQRTAVLVDPNTSITTTVALADGYSTLSLVTDAVGGASTDTVLLYGTNGPSSVALWSLGRASGQPYRSVEVVSLATPIAAVRDVPAPRSSLKILEGQGATAFYVMNLATRTAAPLTASRTASLVVSSDAERLWVFEKGGTDLARISLSDLHPVFLPVDRVLDSVFDVVRADGGRSLVAVDARGAVGATLLDVNAPDTTSSRAYYGFLLEEL